MSSAEGWEKACPALEAMQPRPSEQYLVRPEVGESQGKLAALLADDESPLLVRVEFDSQIAMGTTCAGRTSEQKQRRARGHLAEQLPTNSTISTMVAVDVAVANA